VERRIGVVWRRGAEDAEERRAVERVDLLEVPLPVAERVRREEDDRLADRAAIRRGEVPQVHAGAIAERGQFGETVEIARAVAPAVRARELDRLTALTLDL